MKYSEIKISQCILPLRSATLLKERPWASNYIKKEDVTQVFSCEFYKISKNDYFIENTSVAASKKLKLLYSTIPQLSMIIKIYFGSSPP